MNNESFIDNLEIINNLYADSGMLHFEPLFLVVSDAIEWLALTF